MTKVIGVVHSFLLMITIKIVSETEQEENKDSLSFQKKKKVCILNSKLVLSFLTSITTKYCK